MDSGALQRGAHSLHAFLEMSFYGELTTESLSVVLVYVFREQRLD